MRQFKKTIKRSRIDHQFRVGTELAHISLDDIIGVLKALGYLIDSDNGRFIQVRPMRRDAVMPQIKAHLGIS